MNEDDELISDDGPQVSPKTSIRDALILTHNAG